MQFFKTMVNRPPKIWFPLAIVLLNGVITFLYGPYLGICLSFFENSSDVMVAGPNVAVFSGFCAISYALIDWILISVLLFFGCRLLYCRMGVFRDFFKIIGIWHLVPLIATLSHFIFILLSVPFDLAVLEYNTTSWQERSETIIEALTSVKLLGQAIDIVVHICFVLILIVVVQVYFEIGSGQALCNVCISYAIYWVLNIALWISFFFIFWLSYRSGIA